MTRHSFLHCLLAVLTLLALLLPMSPSPSLLAQKEVEASPASATADTEAPAPVINVTASTGTAPGTVDLNWIAPGDDGTTGTASAYVVRYNTVPITESNWASSSNVSNEPTPQVAGSVESMTVSGLVPGRTYYLALKTQDEVPNTSGVSNSPGARTQNSPNAVYLPLVVSSASNLPPVIPETTEILPGTATQYLTSISGDGTVFTFSQSTPELQALNPGDIMVGEVAENAPYGFLRKVTSTSSSAGQVIVNTTGATLEEAIESGSLQVSHLLTPGDVRSGTLARGVTLAEPRQVQGGLYFLYTLDDVVLYDDDGDPDTTNDQITASGSIRLEPRFDFGLAVDGFHLEELSFTSGADETAELKIVAEVDYPIIKTEKEIAEHHFNPITVAIGPFPVVIVPVLTVNVGVDGSVHIGVTTGVTQEAALRAGLRYASGTWSPVREFSNEFHFNPPQLSAGVDLKGYAGAQLSLLLYGVTGPYAKVNAYLKLEADPFAVPWWQLYGGLEVPVGVEIEIFSHLIAGYEATVIDYRLLLAQAQENNPPDAPWAPSPADGAAHQSLNTDLNWTGGDQDGDAVTYDVYFEAHDPMPDALVSASQPASAYDPGMLAADTDYYWRIVARDEHGATNAGPVWTFNTGTSANNPPSVPTSPSPADGATEQDVEVDLAWSGGDPDGDAVTYDVFLEVGDSAPDLLVCDDVSATTCDPGTLIRNTRYYWRIVAQDEYGASNAGPVWDFETMPEAQDGDMHLLVEVTEDPECYPPCVMAPFHIVEYILPRPDHCGSEPYPGDPSEIVWSPNQENVEHDLRVGDIVEVYGKCWLDLGIYPAVRIPPEAPYFLRKASESP
jgi:hypothetical protein